MIIHSLPLFGVSVLVKVVSPDELSVIAGALEEDEAYLHGCTDLSSFEIYISSALTPDVQRYTLSHELIELANHVYGMELEHDTISVLGAVLNEITLTELLVRHESL